MELRAMNIQSPYAEYVIVEYNNLTYRPDVYGPLPEIGDIAEKTWETLDLYSKENEIQDAIGRKENEWYGLDKNTYWNYAVSGRIPNFKYEEITAEETVKHVFWTLNDYHLSYMDYQKNVIFSPIGGGVW